MKQTRIKVTYVAVDEEKIILLTASTFDDLKLGLDDYYGVDTTDRTAKCLGFTPYQTKYPDYYEGYYEYEFMFGNEIHKDRVNVYCVDYYPHTKYEVEI